MNEISFSQATDGYLLYAHSHRLVQRFGVHANPHKFRHTRVTMFLRNGGNAFALEEILGHSTMTMVNRYVHLAQVDADPVDPTEQAHRQKSPVYNWDLRV